MGDIINREQFEQLGIDKQVELINNWLKNSSLNEVAKMIGYSYESAIRKRFKKAGYERRGKKFVLVIGTGETRVETIVEPVETTQPAQKKAPKIDKPKKVKKASEDAIKDVIKDATTDTTTELIQTQNNYKETTEPVIYDKAVEERIDSLERAVAQLQELLQIQHNYNTTTAFSLYKTNETAVSRSYRIYPTVLEKLEAIKELYSEYSTQDIINSLLMEAMSNYLK